MDNYLKGISNINSESITIIRSFLNQKSEFPCVKNGTLRSSINLLKIILDPLTNDRGSWDNSDDETHVGVDDDITVNIFSE
jgi:hypothetical protein